MKNLPTVLLTGANGFLGSHLLEALLGQGYKVVILKRSTSNLWRIEHLLEHVKTYDVDTQSLNHAFEEQQIDCLIHLACHYGRNTDPLHLMVESNLLYGLKLLEASITHRVSTFINADSLLPRNLNSYILSKSQFVDWLKLHSKKIQVVNLKIEHMYGPKDDTNKFLPWIISQFKEKASEIRLTKGEQKRDFIYIDDVVSAYLIVLEKLPTLIDYNEYEVGTGQALEIKEVLEQLKELYEASFGKITSKMVFGALPYREGEMMSVKVNNQSLIDLGWLPKIKLQQGLKKYLEDIV